TRQISATRSRFERQTIDRGGDKSRQEPVGASANDPRCSLSAAGQFCCEQMIRDAPSPLSMRDAAVRSPSGVRLQTDYVRAKSADWSPNRRTAVLCWNDIGHCVLL